MCAEPTRLQLANDCMQLAKWISQTNSPLTRPSGPWPLTAPTGPQGAQIVDHPTVASRTQPTWISRRHGPHRHCHPTAPGCTTIANSQPADALSPLIPQGAQDMDQPDPHSGVQRCIIALLRFLLRAGGSRQLKPGRPPGSGGTRQTRRCRH